MSEPKKQLSLIEVRAQIKEIQRQAIEKRISELVKTHGSLRLAARAVGIDHAYLHRLATGEKENPSDRILRKLKA